MRSSPHVTTINCCQDIGIRSVTVQHGSLGFKVSGDITNAGQKTVMNLLFRIKIFDTGEDDCIQIGEEHVGVDVRIPPNQRRGFCECAFFRNLPTFEALRFEVELVQIESVLPEETSENELEKGFGQ